MPADTTNVTIAIITLFIVIPPVVERLSTFDKSLSQDTRSRSRS
jgi:hypothetical protein